MTCARCQDVRWVCEAHPDKPWDKRLLKCNAGEPCPDCNSPGAELPVPDVSSQFDTIDAVASGVTVPRRTYIGTRDEPPADEAEHFGKCELCGAWVDRRDLGAVADHQGPLPHPAEDQPQ
jgi:hypothetical protein